MLESDIVVHCAPTLAGIKTANMFNYLPDDMEDLPREVQEENRKLNGKGVYVEILRTGEKRALIYVYRKNKLEADLNREGAHPSDLWIRMPGNGLLSSQTSGPLFSV